MFIVLFVLRNSLMMLSLRLTYLGHKDLYTLGKHDEYFTRYAFEKPRVDRTADAWQDKTGVVDRLR